MVEDDLVLVLKSSVLGDGEPDLGEKLMVSFLAQFVELESVPAKIICMNSGVFLSTTKGSPALDILRQLEEAGARVFTCGTCLEYYGRRDQLQVGSVGDMKDTVRSLLKSDRIVQP